MAKKIQKKKAKVTAKKTSKPKAAPKPRKTSKPKVISRKVSKPKLFPKSGIALRPQATAKVTPGAAPKTPIAASGVPTGVKVVSVLYYIGAVVSLIVGILFLVGVGMIGSVLESMPVLALLGAGLLILAAIIFIALAVLAFFVARGLWRGRNWARITAIVLAIIGVVLAIISIATGSLSSIVSLIIHVVIGGYLAFSNRVKAAFS